MTCPRCSDRVVMPAAVDVANTAGLGVDDGANKFYVRSSPLHPKDSGPCVMFALPDGEAMRWHRLTRKDALQLAAALEREAQAQP